MHNTQCTMHSTQRTIRNVFSPSRALGHPQNNQKHDKLCFPIGDWRFFMIMREPPPVLSAPVCTPPVGFEPLFYCVLQCILPWHLQNTWVSGGAAEQSLICNLFFILFHSVFQCILLWHLAPKNPSAPEMLLTIYIYIYIYIYLIYMYIYIYISTLTISK